MVHDLGLWCWMWWPRNWRLWWGGRRAEVNVVGDLAARGGPSGEQPVPPARRPADTDRDPGPGVPPRATGARTHREPPPRPRPELGDDLVRAPGAGVGRDDVVEAGGQYVGQVLGLEPDSRRATLSNLALDRRITLGHRGVLSAGQRRGRVRSRRGTSRTSLRLRTGPMVKGWPRSIYALRSRNS